MRVFLRNIPKNTTTNELAHYIKRHLNRGLSSWFSTPVSVNHIEIVKQLDDNLRVISYHGLANIENDKSAKRMIKRLRKAQFKGRRISVREFVVRIWHNDKRDQAIFKNNPSNDRRKSDRRQSKLETVIKTQNVFTSDELYARKLGF